MIGSSPQDKRDLWLTFGLDSKIQKKDPFIHNANAAYRRKDLLDHPFSEAMTNIEDRGWAEFQLSLGKKFLLLRSCSLSWTWNSPDGKYSTLGGRGKYDGKPFSKIWKIGRILWQ